MSRENIAALLFVVTWLVVVGVSLFTRTKTVVSNETAKFLGMIIFLLGMLVFAWAAVHLKASFLGTVEPVSDKLVTTGPYRFVRHPVYLGMTVATIGLIIGMRSLWGLAGIFLLFIPAEIYRARLEEIALARKFGKEWDNYSKQTYFMFILIY